MRKMRIKYKKIGRCAYLSHLDTMRTLQRVIARAKIPVKHSEGFNPHPYLSIALPLSLGYTSDCELMDIIALNDMSCDDIVNKINTVMPEGLIALSAYEDGGKVGNISASGYEVTFEYDNGIPDSACEKIERLFTSQPLMLVKRSKSGEKEVDISQFIKKISVKSQGNIISVSACLSAGNDNLNPEYLLKAVERYLPESAPDFAKYHRVAVFDKNLKEFK